MKLDVESSLRIDEMAKRSEILGVNRTLDGKSDFADTGSSGNARFRRMSQSQSEAFALLCQELDQCRAQRDQFKAMAEQMQMQLSQSKRQIHDGGDAKRSFSTEAATRAIDKLMEVREENKCLRLQVQTLMQKLGDAQADIRVLRSNHSSSSEQNNVQLAPDIHQREEMIEHLEKLNIKCTQLQTDLQTVLDEKHELEMERDAFKCKSHRLNHRLSNALNAKTTIELDGLINENRFLQESLEQLLEEKELAQQSLSKYKGMLDCKRTKGTIKLGGNSAAGTVMTYKQVEQLLQQESQIPPQKSAAAISDLRRLCAALLEALNDKTLALVHQKKANKILASRICELDTAVRSPTMKLLEGYVGADVDATLEGDSNDPEYESKSTSCDALEKREDGLQSCERKPEPTRLPVPRSTRVYPVDLPELPKNLGELVEKALLSLKDNEKDK